MTKNRPDSEPTGQHPEELSDTDEQWRQAAANIEASEPKREPTNKEKIAAIEEEIRLLDEQSEIPLGSLLNVHQSAERDRKRFSLVRDRDALLRAEENKANLEEQKRKNELDRARWELQNEFSKKTDDAMEKMRRDEIEEVPKDIENLNKLIGK